MGNGSLVADDVRATKISASIKSGNGTITVAGHCEEASLNMLGNGTIQADRLEAEKVSCNILGSGTIGCWTTVDLKVRGIGSTKIYYKGDPRIKKSGGGKLFPLTQDILEY